jgi:head-tail adaptor
VLCPSTFTTLLRIAQKARATVNRGYYRRIAQGLDKQAKGRFDRLFVRDGNRSAWDLLKSEPRRPTAKELKRFVAHLNWLREQAGAGDPLAGIPAVKTNRFAAEARALNVARMSELIPEKRYTLAAALVFQQRTRAFDDAGEMFIRLVKRAEAHADEILKQRQAEHIEEASALVRTLHNIALAYASDGTSEERLQAIGSLLEPDMERLIQRCEEHAALMNGKAVRLLPSQLRSLRPALLLLLEHLPLESTSQDDSLRRAIAFLLAHRNSRSELLPITSENDDSESPVAAVNLSFIPYGRPIFCAALRVQAKKNKLYFALRELGRVVRTIFLLRYISDLDLRHTIQTATTKSERFKPVRAMGLIWRRQRDCGKRSR